MAASGKADAMTVGGILVARFGRIRGHHSVRQEAMGRAALADEHGVEAFEVGEDDE